VGNDELNGEITARKRTKRAALIAQGPSCKIKTITEMDQIFE